MSGARPWPMATLVAVGGELICEPCEGLLASALATRLFDRAGR